MVLLSVVVWMLVLTLVIMAAPLGEIAAHCSQEEPSPTAMSARLYRKWNWKNGNVQVLSKIKIDLMSSFVTYTINRGRRSLQRRRECCGRERKRRKTVVLIHAGITVGARRFFMCKKPNS